MKRTWLPLLVWVSFATVNQVYSEPVPEDEPLVLRKQGDWWLGVDAGGGAVEIEYPVGTLSENKFYLGLRAEYVYSQKILLGIEASGWLIQPGEMEYTGYPPPLTFGDQLEGEGLAPVLLTVRYYPWNDDGWYLKAGAGYVSHWITHEGETDREHGWGGMLGGGYDFYINESWDITTFLTYSTGQTGDEKYDAVTLAVGFNYKFGRN